MSGAVATNQALRDRFEAQWALLSPAVPVERPNQGSQVDKSGAVWARLSFLSDYAPEHESAGPGSAERFYERVQLEIFTRLGEGNRRALEIADAFAAMWRSSSDGTPAVADYTFYPTQVIPVGYSESIGPWWKVDCLTAYQRSYQP